MTGENSNLPYGAWLYDQNGFASFGAMAKAHQPVVDAATEYLPEAGRVLDLGCGNGALLRALCDRRGDAVPFGVDCSAGAIARARALFPLYASHFRVGDLFEDGHVWEAGQSYDLVLLMPGRLLETTPQRAETLRQRLRTHGRRLLIYGHGDWIQGAGGLHRLARQTGLMLSTRELRPRVSLASVVSGPWLRCDP